MTDESRETRVLDAVVTLVDSLFDDFDVVDLLTDLTERCADLLGVAAAGFLLADPMDRLRVLPPPPNRRRRWSCSSCSPTKGRVWTAIAPVSRSRSLI